MNVLFHNSNRSSAFGGIEHWMLDVSAGLAARGHHVVLYGRRKAGWLQEAKRRGLPTVAGSFYVDLDPRSILSLTGTLRRHSVDVVFVKGKKGARIAAVASRVLGHGRVVLVLGLDGELTDCAVDRWTWRFAIDRAIVLAEEAKLCYERLPWIRGDRMQVLFKGVDLQHLDPRDHDGAAIRGALEIPQDALVVGTVGRLVWEKGHTWLLQAAARLRASLPDARFLIVGAGEKGEQLRAQARDLGIEERVVFAGYQRDIAPVLAAMDIFALPSRKENMPQVLLEAMAMERPVVSTGTIGVREVLEDGRGGFVVPTGDVEAFADRVLQLAGDLDLRQAMGKQARARIARGFTREDMLGRIEHLMTGLGCSPRPGPLEEEHVWP
jgi:glycosyltransferase involved in cell wall biosynthesis